MDSNPVIVTGSSSQKLQTNICLTFSLDIRGPRGSKWITSERTAFCNVAIERQRPGAPFEKASLSASFNGTRKISSSKMRGILKIKIQTTKNNTLIRHLCMKILSDFSFLHLRLLLQLWKNVPSSSQPNQRTNTTYAR